MEQLAYDHGVVYDAYLAVEPDRESLWDVTFGAFVSFVTAGRHAFATGGLIGPPERHAALLDGALGWFRARNRSIAFFNVTPDALDLFRDRGFEVTRWGMEPIVALDGRTWQGGEFAWLRRQASYCRRAGLTVEEVDHRSLAEAAWRREMSDIRGVARSSNASRAQLFEMRVFDGRFLPHHLHRRRLFVARNVARDGRVEAFVLCNPARGGTRWSTELYRHRSDAVRGATAFVIFEAIRQLQADGVADVSLALVPGLGTERPSPGDSALARRSLQFTWRYLDFVYDMRGLLHFKTRFRPHFEDRYIAVYPRVTARSIAAFLYVSRVGILHPVRTLRLAARNLRSRARRTMVDPSMVDLAPDLPWQSAVQSVEVKPSRAE